MPIRINLLAETQAAEDLRRRDPAKRLIYCGAFLVALMLVWSSSLRLEAMMAKKEVGDRQTLIQTHTNEFNRILMDQKNMAAFKEKLGALNKLTNSRFLQGNLLNALQLVNVDGVQMTRLAVNQDYFYVAGTRAQTNGWVTEKIVVKIDARDSSTNPGDEVNKFKEAVASQSYFQTMLKKTNGVQLVNLSASQVGPDGKPFVTFTLECNFPEQTR
jgi:hypothetical protein